MKYKYSKYNILVEVDCKTLSIFNTLSNNHININISEISINHFLNNCNIPLLPKEVFKYLLQNKFIINDSRNELDVYLKKCNKFLQKDHGLRLTVLPTLACNFNCKYCFETKNNNIRMDINTTKKLMNFVEVMLKNETLGDLNVTWFGGEPLLEAELIKLMTKDFKYLTNKYNRNFFSYFITNGYFLERLDENCIKNMNLKNVFVTIDGLEKTHNRRRPNISGKGSFKKIIRNIQALLKYFADITILITVDNENVHEIGKLLVFLKENEIIPKCKFKIKYTDYKTGKYTLTNCNKNIPNVELLSKKVYEDLYNLDLFKYINVYPKIKCVTCGAQIKNDYTISADGSIYKCVNDATIKEYKIGDVNQNERIILNGGNNKVSRKDQILSFSAVNNSICRECKYLPICAGGCAVKYINEPANAHCSNLKYSLKNILKQISK